MSPTPLRWERHPATQLAGDPALARAWDRLNAMRKDLPFLSASALIGALEVFGSADVQLLCASEDERPCAMFLLQPQGRWRWASFQPSQLPLGAWVSDGSRPLAALAHELQRKALGPCLVLSITQIDPWLEPRPDEAPCATLGDYVETGWIDIGPDFEAYWALRGKNLRQNMRKQRNRLDTDSVTTTLLEYRQAEDMASCIERYGSIESKGWKAQEGTAIHPDNDQGRFYRRMFESAAHAGEAVAYEYRFNDSPVAMDLCLLRSDLLVVLKTTYDESIKHCSPAFLLRQDELQTLFQQGRVKRLEFYGKFMEWHSRWTENKRMLYHHTQYRWAWLQRLAEARRARHAAALASDEARAAVAATSANTGKAEPGANAPAA